MAAAFVRNPPHELCYGRVTDKTLHQSKSLTAACLYESYAQSQHEPKQPALASPHLVILAG